MLLQELNSEKMKTGLRVSTFTNVIFFVIIHSIMIIKLSLLIIFFAVFIFVGIKCRAVSNNVNGYVLGGRTVGPWLTAFAYGTSYFSAVIFVGYAGQFGWNFGVAAPAL